MSSPAVRLAAEYLSATQAARDARWLTLGTVVTAEPLVVNVDGVEVRVLTYTGAVPTTGELVVLGVLRGSPSVGYVAIGRIVPSLPEGLYNSAEGGTHGIAATSGNTGGDSGDAFTSVNTSGAGAVTFDSTHSSMAYKIATVSGGYAYVQWDLAETQWTCGLRQELYLPDYPDPGVGVAVLAEVRRLGGATAVVSVDDAGALTLYEAGALATSPDATLPLDSWCRIEAALDFTNGAGTYHVAVYPSRTSTTATWEDSGPWAWDDGSGSGCPAEGYIFGATGGFETLHYWIDNLAAITTAALPGPA